ncbi:MAG: TIGR04282 family arsenosugar biosynthesis glycosyltransferase [Gemmatimonadales bacterium]
MRALGILAAAPIPGRVMPRLADDVGPSAAAELYARVGRGVIAAVAGSGYRTILWFTPPTEGAYVREWLDGLGRVELRPQAAAGPGARIHHAFTRHFGDGARRVVVVTTDCPGIERRTVTQAFAALAQHDVVLGPTTGGGCYLVGLRDPHPELVHPIPWETAAALPQTRAHARALALSVHLLAPLRGLETLQDARVLGLLKP